MNSPRDEAAELPHDGTGKATYETPTLKSLGKIGDLTLGVPTPQIDVLFVGSL